MVKRSWKVPAGKAVTLTQTERDLARDVRAALDDINAKIRSNMPIAPAAMKRLGEIAHQLHMSLKANGQEPKHTKIMVQNRGFKPTAPEFYAHVHPVEDLLGFLENENANDDAVDLTIGSEFTFPVYSRRWSHKDTYRLTRTTSGWKVSHLEEVETGRDARVAGKDGTGLFHLFDHDSINYPEALPGYLEWLWEQARDRGLDPAEVQQGITDLADWVSVCEESSPRGVFQGYK
jgi:hypothetical protein